MRGRKPVPTVIRMARGNPGHHPRNHDEPKPGELAEDCPPELTLEEERAEWTRTIVPAITTGQITQADRTFAIAHCHYWATWRDQLADAARHPNIIGVGPNKHPTPNPARGMANTTFLLLAKVDAELGLTPSSRPRVKATRPAGQASSISRYLSAIPGGKASNH